MRSNYTINAILLAVNEIRNSKRKDKIEIKNTKSINKNNKDIPINTLKLIEEAEKIKN